jgi:hypothetical protein
MSMDFRTTEAATTGVGRTTRPANGTRNRAGARAILGFIRGLPPAVGGPFATFAPRTFVGSHTVRSGQGRPRLRRPISTPFPRAARCRAASRGGSPMRDTAKFGAETTASEVASGIAERLWEVSEKLVGERFAFSP